MTNKQFIEASKRIGKSKQRKRLNAVLDGETFDLLEKTAKRLDTSMTMVIDDAVKMYHKNLFEKNGKKK